MFKIGDYVVHGRNGVCKVVDITHIDISGADKNQLYYTLIPMKMTGSVRKNTKRQSVPVTVRSLFV